MKVSLNASTLPHGHPRFDGRLGITLIFRLINSLRDTYVVKGAKANNEFFFSVDAQLVGELGQRLVTRNHVALAELIKNAYDADATRVSVTFLIPTHKKDTAKRKSVCPRIIVEDNGSGMNRQIVHDHWMRIGTANKRQSPVSDRFGRPRTGSKGVGRFACERLAHRLLLETVGEDKRKSHELTVVEFDWDRYKPGMRLDEVGNEVQSSRTDKETVTRLSLIDLRDRWLQRDFNTLKREVLELSLAQSVTRPGFELDPGLQISLDAPNFDMGEGLLLRQFMDSGWGLLKGLVSSRGDVNLQLTCASPEDGYDKIHKLKFPEKLHSLSGIEFEYAFLPMNGAYWRNRTIARLGPVRETLRESGGIKIYLNDFRIFPYGSPQDDWLNVEQDTARRLAKLESSLLRSMAGRLGLDGDRLRLETPRYRSLYGHVAIDTRKTDEFKVNISREGLVENNAYLQLVELLRFSIEWLTIHYAQFKHARQSDASKKDTERLRGLLADDQSIPTKVSGDRVALQALRRHAQILEKGSEERSIVEAASKVLHSELSTREAELALLRSLSSTGPLVLAFTHEIRALILSLESAARKLVSIGKNLSQSRQKEVKEASAGLRQTKKRFIDLSSLFNLMSGATGLTPKRHFLRKVVSSIESGFGFVFGQFGIHFEMEIPKSLKTPQITEAELYSVLINVLSNSIKACAASDGEIRKIKLEARTSKKSVCIRLSDTGVGLAKEHWKSVFTPLVVDPTGEIYGSDSLISGVESDLLGKGSGLGLSIVKSIVERYGGDVSFRAAPKDWSTEIQIVLPIS